MVGVFLIPDKKSQVSFKIAISYARQASVLQGLLEWCLGSFHDIHLRLQHVNHVRTKCHVICCAHLFRIGVDSSFFINLINSWPKTFR